MLTKNARYYYDADAIKEPASEFDWESRKGRAKLNHKTMPTDKVNGIRPDVKYTPNGKAKPYFKDAREFDGKNADKQRGHSRRHAGFNDRWDAMTKAEQTSGFRNKRDVWTVSPANYPDAHFATFPPALIEPCILAGSRVGDIVLDPFMGSGTTAQVAQHLGRRWIGIELNPEYEKLQRSRIAQTSLELT
jgi:site-specific DNA-methyltransferase (cytosine-N4-specific)